jgi:ATP-dependent Lon protease
LIGKVLPVGGIKEKLLAARRAGINTVILPKLNEKDLIEVPDYALSGMTIHYVSHVEEVFDLVLTPEAKTPKTKVKATRVLRKKEELKPRITSRVTRAPASHLKTKR